jgi:hypothetical protein
VRRPSELSPRGRVDPKSAPYEPLPYHPQPRRLAVGAEGVYSADARTACGRGQPKATYSLLVDIVLEIESEKTVMVSSLRTAGTNRVPDYNMSKY